jgi:hypothetical protein
MSAEWLNFLRHVAKIEVSRSPGLLVRILTDEKYPPREALRPLASGLFPAGCLSRVERAVVLLHGKGRGLDTLLPIHDHNIRLVAVFHSDERELDALRETYPANWHYAKVESNSTAALSALVAEADILVAETPPERSTEYLRTSIGPLKAPQLLLSVDEALLVILGCDALDRSKVSKRMSWLLGIAYACRGIYFRHGDPTPVYWLWLKVE